MRLRRRNGRRPPEADETAAGKPAGSLSRAPVAPAGPVLANLVAFVHQILMWPWRLWLRAVEVAGKFVLSGCKAVVLPLLSALRAALRFSEREVTPARGLAVVALAATIGLGASQFSDYRAVEVGAASYRAVENVAPAP